MPFSTEYKYSVRTFIYCLLCIILPLNNTYISNLKVVHLLHLVHRPVLLGTRGLPRVDIQTTTLKQQSQRNFTNNFNLKPLKPTEDVNDFFQSSTNLDNRGPYPTRRQASRRTVITTILLDSHA